MQIVYFFSDVIRTIADKEPVVMSDVGIRGFRHAVIIVFDHIVPQDVPSRDDPVFDAGILQLQQNFFPVDLQRGIHDHGKAEPGAFADFSLDDEAIVILEKADEMFSVLSPDFNKAFQFVELLAADGAMDLAWPYIVTGQNEPVCFKEVLVPSLKNRTVLVLSTRPAVVSDRLQEIVYLLIIGQYEPALHGRNMMREKGAERVHQTECPGMFTVEPGPHGLAVVFEKNKIVLLAESGNLIKLAGVSQDAEITRLCQENNLILFEDNCES